MRGRVRAAIPKVIYKPTMESGLLKEYKHLTRMPGMRPLSGPRNINGRLGDEFRSVLERPEAMQQDLVKTSIDSLTSLFARQQEFHKAFLSYRHSLPRIE